ncbi:MAG: ATP-binding protein [Firmicutes bacterium]|nr:ATP-binding protein [Bacillota bacterium]
MRRFSITTKITIWYTIFLVIITIGFLSVMAYVGNVRASEIARSKLMDHVADASEEIESFGENFIIDEDLDFYEDGVYLSIYTEDGDLLEGRRPAELPELPALKDKAMVKMNDEQGQTWYVYDSSFEMGSQAVWVRGIVKDFAEQSSFSFMLKLVLVACPALVVIAALGGYIITRRAFRPVRIIISTVEEISRDGDLTRRLNLQDGNLQDAAAKDEIHKLAKNFNSMFDRIEESFEKEKQFTSDVSHELRTPLSVIISQSDYARTDEEYREKALEVINREAKRMAGLVNRLLTLSRSDSGRLVLENDEIDFSEMCEMVAMQQEPAASRKNIELTADIEPGIKVTGDDAMLIRIILNLTDNAIKYSRQNGHVRLSLKTAGDFACCSVEDDGIGIPEEDLERIWERFYRVDSSRSEEGSGLGLAMVEALVKAHGGYTDVRSSLGEGSRFNVYIPIRRTQE